MNKELLLSHLKEKEITRKVKEEKNSDRKISHVSYFAGEEYNEILAQNQELQGKIGTNIIDFGQLESEKGDFIEKKLIEIDNDDKNKQLIEKRKYPIIWFKNIEKIKKNSSLESSLLPVFDTQQNTKLFGKNLNLSNYILITTSSTRDTGKLSSPLTNRLECINVKTAEPKSFFLNKYYGWVLFSSVFLIIILLTIFFWPNKKVKQKE